jgi:hypothetical protein
MNGVALLDCASIWGNRRNSIYVSLVDEFDVIKGKSVMKRDKLPLDCELHLRSQHLDDTSQNSYFYIPNKRKLSKILPKKLGHNSHFAIIIII